MDSTDHSLPERVVVVGSGAGGLTIAADLALRGVAVTVADGPEFGSQLEPLRQQGGIRLDCGWHEMAIAPIAEISDDPKRSGASAEVIIVSVPAFAHAAVAALLAPILTDEHTLLWAGEGGGALSTVHAMRSQGRRPGLLLGETNTLPYRARVVAPGRVMSHRKTGGTLVAALPTNKTEMAFALASAIWPWVSPAESVWETVLVNFNAIDHVPTLLLNFGTIEGRKGPMLLWGEGATPGVARAIEAVDLEILAIRSRLRLANRKRYADFLVAQGMAHRVEQSLHETIQASLLSGGIFQCGPEAINHRYIAEDIPYALALIASIGREIDIETPVIDALVTLGSAVLGRDLASEGRSLENWDLAGTGCSGLVAAATHGWW